MDIDLDEGLEEFQHLKIQLEKIKSATDNFNNENFLGVGGFGEVYKGELSHSKGRSMVAIKRLNLGGGQGALEFLKEITMLSNYKHENLISLLGFCYEAGEMILVYDYASHGSLNHHLNSPHFTWSKRLSICLDAAKGISYLHDPKETHQRLIHCDIKSANILLDAHWRAKVSDFGLAMMGPANEQNSTIITFASGTNGYCDPQFARTHTLTKESDVYSFGVVLLEIFCGTVCRTYRNGRVEKDIVPTWIKSYEKKKLNDIMFKNPTIKPLTQSALQLFSNIAYKCLKASRKDRPKMAEVVTQLEDALEFQELYESQVVCKWKEPVSFYDDIARSVKPPLRYKTGLKLWTLLSKGVLLDQGKRWFSINKKGEHYEMISCEECIKPGAFELYAWSHGYGSRFAKGTYHSVRGKFKARIKSQFLSPKITYMVNLVLKFMLSQAVIEGKCHVMSLKYKLQGEKSFSTSYFAYEREDGWWMVELYQFTNDKRTHVEVEILFDGSDHQFEVIEVEGIEFQPLERAYEKLDMQPISYSCANWEENLPID